MLTQVEMLKMLVGLKEVNDLDLVDDNAVMVASCQDSDRVVVRAMAKLIEEIYDSFSYEMSPEFIGKLEGKSEQVQTMHRKLLDQSKRKDVMRRLGESLTQILTSNGAFELVRLEHHHLLVELKELAESIGQD